MLGLVMAPQGGAAGDSSAAAVLLIHDAFGISEEMIGNATRLAAAGHPVFLADVWGERATPASVTEIGPLIGAMAQDHDLWLGRVAAPTRRSTRSRSSPAVHWPSSVTASAVPRRSSTSAPGQPSPASPRAPRARPARPGLEHSGIGLRAADDRRRRPDGDASHAAPARGTPELRRAGAPVPPLQRHHPRLHQPEGRCLPEPEVFAYNARSAARAWAATTGFLAELSAPAS